jgi:hypothetical protein
LTSGSTLHIKSSRMVQLAMLLIKVPTSAPLADILTKGLHFAQSTMCVEGILGRRST